MIFVYRKWKSFCETLQNRGIISIPACDVKSDSGNYLVLKHDVETNVPHAYEVAKIEHAYKHRGSYYVQAYLLDNPDNVRLLKQMQEMGHEISYHYDVMDSCQGNLDSAIKAFEKNRKLFEDNGFSVVTVCQHGNPVIERKGYNSNRDFFRNNHVQELYSNISDIMVNFENKIPTDYLYFSDAGREFKLIYDPINNDIINSDDKNITFADLEILLNNLDPGKGNIISIHPHRWTRSSILYVIKNWIFKIVKTIAKILMNVPVFKKIMSKYYYLAKKV